MEKAQDKWFQRLRDLAEQALKNQPVDAKNIDSTDISKLINNIQVFQAELEIQNDELRSTVDELEKSRTRFSRLFDMAPAGYIILDASGIILDVNQTMLDMVHKCRDDLMRKPFSRFIASEDQNIFLARFSPFYKNPANKTMEIRLIKGSSSIFHARLEGRFIPLETVPGKPDIDQFCLIVTDITETKKAENELKNYAHMLNERSKELHCLYSISRLINDPANSMDDFFNQTITILTNAMQYPDKVCGRIKYKNRDYATPNFKETECKQTSDIIANDEIIGSVEIYYVKKIPFNHDSPFLEEEQALIHSVAMRLGQTIARKQAENKLREQKKRLEGIIEGTNVGTWEWNVQTGKTVFNDKWAQIIGYDLEELEPVTIKTWEAHAHPEDFKKSREALKLHFSGKLPYYDIECRMKHKDGHWVEVHDRGKVITWTPDGKPLMMFGTHQDITQRKQAEQREKQTKKYLETILQTTADGFWVIDTLGKLIDVNDAYCRMTGYAKNQILGMSISDLDGIESFEVTAERIERIVANGFEFFETQQRHRDGSLFPVEVSSTWLPIDGGLLVCFGRDIAERKQAEEALRISEERFSLAMDATKDGIWDWDLTTGDIYCSPGLTSMLGYDSTNVIANVDQWQDLIHPEDRQKAYQANIDCANNLTEFFEIEYRMKTSSGGWKWILGRGQAVYRNTSGRALRMIGTHQDTTERKKIEKQLLQAEKAESLSRMAGAVAHHFNNILMITLGNLEMIQEDIPQGSETANSLKEAAKAAQRAVALSQLMRTYLGQGIRANEKIDLSEFCRGKMKDLSRAMPDNICLTTRFVFPGLIVQSDHRHLEQLLNILFENAVESLVEKTSGNISVTLESVETSSVQYFHVFPNDWHADSEAYARLVFSDTGKGMAEETIHLIFDPFYSDKFTGRGLGLAVALGIVKAHNGCICVNSKPEKGTDFIILLPLSTMTELGSTWN